MFVSLLTIVVLAVPIDDPVRFRKDIAPILVQRCLACHDAEDPQGGLDLTTFAKLRQGGDIEGEAILTPGEPDASHLVAVIRSDARIRMPYKQDPLTDAQIATIERWVAEGAKFDGPSEADTTLATLVDPLTDVVPIAPKVSAADPVAAAAFSADGRRIAAARGAEVLIYEDGATTPRTFADHPGPVHFVAFSPDGASLIAAGGKSGLFGFIAAWDLATGAKRAETRAHADSVAAAALSPDGSTLATCSYDRLIKLWDVATLAERSTLKEHTDAVYAVAFSRDGTRLASAGGDRTVKVWDAATGRRLVSLGDATAELFAAAFGPDGRELYAAGADRTIWSWTLEGESGRLARSAIAHDAAVLDLAVSGDGTRLYSTGEDRAVKVWELPGLKPLAALEKQPDWPQALAASPDGTRLAIGRYDGSLVVAPVDGGAAVALLDAPKADDGTKLKKPDLIREATLGPPAPRGAPPGKTLTLQLSGDAVGRAESVVFDDPAIVAKITTRSAAKPNELAVEVQVGAAARVGTHRFWVTTPSGTPAAQPFLVFEADERAEAEPNDGADQANATALPATLAGTIDKPGDVDRWRFELAAGQELTLIDRSRTLGSTLDPLYELLDATGKVVASGRGDLVHRAEAAGPFTLRIADLQFGGTGNHLYRIEAGFAPFVEDIFPRGVEIGGTTALQLQGRNLRPGPHATNTGSGVPPNTLVPIFGFSPDGARLSADGPKVVAAEGPQPHEAEPNDAPREGATTQTDPFGVAGRIAADGDVDVFRFAAKKGEPLVLEVFASRLGTELDPVLEIIDAEGRPVPRAVLRPVAETAVAFRDHNASQNTIRLTKWDELRADDHLLVGRELMRIFALPRNPDDDARFWTSGGQRLGYLGTTPEQHPMAQPMYRVEIHPPGTTFPPGGIAPVEIAYRNDDGGAGFRKDAYLLFDAPADGDYFARVSDARGRGGDAFAYHLVVRRPRPDFEISVSTENPNVPRGSTRLITASIRRIDGFAGPVDLAIDGLPPGVSATATQIEAEHFTAELALTASSDAPTFSSPSWRVIATASSEGLRHELDPGGPSAGWITVTPAPDLKLSADRDRVEIVPGREARMTFRVQRSAAFGGRVPIEVKNLPNGVRVLDIGLNGVLVTEEQVEREIVLFAEPWVEPTERPFYGVGKVEAANAESSTPAVTLVVRPEP